MRVRARGQVEDHVVAPLGGRRMRPPRVVQAVEPAPGSAEPDRACAVLGDREGSTSAARRIVRIGETSGRDLLVGLGWGLAASAAYEAAASEVGSAGDGSASESEPAAPRAIAR